MLAEMAFLGRAVIKDEHFRVWRAVLTAMMVGKAGCGRYLVLLLDFDFSNAVYLIRRWCLRGKIPAKTAGVVTL